MANLNKRLPGYQNETTVFLQFLHQPGLTLAADDEHPLTRRQESIDNVQIRGSFSPGPQIRARTEIYSGMDSLGKLTIDHRIAYSVARDNQAVRLGPFQSR